MPQGPYVVAISRVGTTVQLAPRESALVFDSSQFTVTDEPDESTTAADGATVTGRVKVEIAAGAYVPPTRTITATAPVRIDGGASADLSANRTISISIGQGLETNSNALRVKIADSTLIRDGSGLAVDPGVVAASPVSGDRFTTTNNTPTAMFTFAMGTGTSAMVEFRLFGKCTGGAGSAGLVDKRVMVGAVMHFVNTGGTPALGSGTGADTGLWLYDEAGGSIPANFGATYAANSVTVTVTGGATLNMDWAVRITDLTIFTE